MVKESTYSTRAWTYQEWFYSSHRLVFTDGQVSLQCPKEKHYEAKIIPYVESADRRKEQTGTSNDPFLDRYSELPNRQDQHQIDGTHYHCDEVEGKPRALRLFEHRVRNYSSRNLTYDADSLDGVRSILSLFLNDPHPIDHLCGLPFQPNTMLYCFQSPTSEVDVCSSFDLAYGLSWTHKNSVTPPRRRTGA
jgi:hypothetical protein